MGLVPLASCIDRELHSVGSQFGVAYARRTSLSVSRGDRGDATLDSTRLDERFAHSLVGIERPRPRARDDEREEGFESHWRRRRQTELRWVHSALSKDREGYREVGHLSHEDRRTMKPLSPCLCVLLGKPLCLTIVGAGVVCSERQSLRRRFDRRDRCDNWCEHPRRSERGEDAGLSIGTA